MHELSDMAYVPRWGRDVGQGKNEVTRICAEAAEDHGGEYCDYCTVCR